MAIMDPYSDAEVAEIEEILNKRFLPLSEFEARNVQIEIEPKYFFNSSKGDPAEAYLVTLFLTKNGEPLDFNPMPFSNKTSTKDVAFHIAHDIWGKFDKSFESPIWKNFDPRG